MNLTDQVPTPEANARQHVNQWLSTSGGSKFDSDKPRLDLIDPFAMEQLAQVLTFGAQKYADHNWRKGIKVSRLIAAALRHTLARLRGERNDPETGLPHMAHAMCCCMFIIWTEAKRPDMDDVAPEITEPPSVFGGQLNTAPLQPGPQKP